MYIFQFLESAHNLDDFIQMDVNKGPGQVLNLTQFVQRFYKPPPPPGS